MDCPRRVDTLAPVTALSTETVETDEKPPAMTQDQKLTLAVVCLASLAVGVDAAGFGATLETLEAKLSLTSEQTTYVLSAYALPAAAVLILSGSLSDRFGRRRVISVGASVMAVGTVVAAAADGAPMLVVARALAGIGGGLISVSALAAVPDVFPTSQRTRAYSLITATGSIGFLLAPLVTSLSVSESLWRLTPLHTLPLFIALVFAVRWLPQRAKDEFGGLDIVGFVLSVLMSFTIFITVSIVLRTGTSVLSLGMVLLSAALLCGFVSWEIRVRRAGRVHPVMETTVFRNRNYVSVVMAAVLGSVGTGAAFLLIGLLATFVLQNERVRHSASTSARLARRDRRCAPQLQGRPALRYKSHRSRSLWAAPAPRTSFSRRSPTETSTQPSW